MILGMSLGDSRVKFQVFFSFFFCWMLMRFLDSWLCWTDFDALFGCSICIFYFVFCGFSQRRHKSNSHRHGSLIYCVLCVFAFVPSVPFERMSKMWKRRTFYYCRQWEHHTLHQFPDFWRTNRISNLPFLCKIVRNVFILRWTFSFFRGIRFRIPRQNPEPTLIPLSTFPFHFMETLRVFSSFFGLWFWFRYFIIM